MISQCLAHHLQLSLAIAVDNLSNFCSPIFDVIHLTLKGTYLCPYQICEQWNQRIQIGRSIFGNITWLHVPNWSGS